MASFKASNRSAAVVGCKPDQIKMASNTAAMNWARWSCSGLREKCTGENGDMKDSVIHT